MVARILALLLTALAIGGGHVLRTAQPEPAEVVMLERVPYEMGAYVGRDIEVRDQVMELLRPDAFLLREYLVEDDLPTQIYVDYHRTQRLGATIHSPRVCYPGAGWQPTRVDVSPVGGHLGDQPGTWLRLQASGEREMLALYWYETRWGRSARETELKLGIVRSAFSRQPSDAALMRFATPLIEGDVAGAERRIRRFVETMEPVLREELPFGHHPEDRKPIDERNGATGSLRPFSPGKKR